MSLNLAFQQKRLAKHAVAKYRMSRHLKIGLMLELQSLEEQMLLLFSLLGRHYSPCFCCNYHMHVQPTIEQTPQGTGQLGYLENVSFCLWNPGLSLALRRNRKHGEVSLLGVDHSEPQQIEKHLDTCCRAWIQHPQLRPGMQNLQKGAG
jgi:hypothetical protein